MFGVLCATSRKKISFFEERVGGEEVLVVGLCGLEKLLRRNALDAAASRVSNGRQNQPFRKQNLADLFGRVLKPEIQF